MGKLHLKTTSKWQTTCILFVVLCFLSCGFAEEYCDINSCGVRCVYLISKLYGLDDISLDNIRNCIPSSEDGISSFADLHICIKKLGLDPKGRKLKFKELTGVAYPTIVKLETDFGPHFVVWGGSKKGRVSIIDPPRQYELTEKGFLNQWNQTGLIVFPLSNDKTSKKDFSDNISPLICLDRVQDLGEYVLPLNKTIETEFTIRNVSDKLVELGRLMPSCGCNEATVSKTELKPNEEIVVNVKVTYLNDSGLKKYSIGVPILNSEVKPLILEFKFHVTPLIQLRPASLDLGRFYSNQSLKPRLVEVLKAAKDVIPEIKSCKPSVSWIHTDVANSQINVNFSPLYRIGKVSEFIEIETNLGAINVPITGEFMGSFRCVPNPLVVRTLDRNNRQFKIIKNSNMTLDLGNLQFTTEEKNIELNLIPNDSDHEKNIMVEIKKPGIYHVKIVDPVSNEFIIMSIYAGL